MTAVCWLVLCICVYVLFKGPTISWNRWQGNKGTPFDRSFPHNPPGTRLLMLTYT